MSIIAVTNVTKEYRLGALQGLKQGIKKARAFLGGKKTPERPRFKALEDVNFTIEEGEVVGLIGHNGAGKSTLLKLLSRITNPSVGTVEVRGRVAPLIEVGAGLVPDLTGRENIFLNGAILGMKRSEIAKKFDEIVEFAELEQFIDTPVKRYSSGMQVRLGFAIATSVDADILLVDEVLAVGDLAFQRKCFDRMEEFTKKRGKSMFLVSHNIRQIERICKRTLLLDHGKIIADGPSAEVCNKFYTQNNEKIKAQHAKSPNLTGVMSSGEIDNVNVRFCEATTGQPTERATMRENVDIKLEFESVVNERACDIGIGFHSTDFVYIATFLTGGLDTPPDIYIGKNHISCTVQNLPLIPGVYGIRVGIKNGAGRMMWYAENVATLAVEGPRGENVSRLSGTSLVEIPVTWHFPQSHHSNVKELTR